MTTKDLLVTLSNCKFHQRYLSAINPPPPPLPPPLPEINWIKRQMLKNQILVKYLAAIAICFITLLIFVILPVLLAYPPYGKSMLLGIPPMIFIAVSWMLSAWWTWDKDRYIFMAVTFGGIPIRFSIGLIWFMLMSTAPTINPEVMVFAMMGYWIVFSISEIAMLIEFSNKLPRNAEQIEP